MKSKIRKAPCTLALAAVMVLAAPPPVLAQGSGPSMDQMMEQMEALQQQMEQLKSQMQAMQAEAEEQKEETEVLREDVDYLDDTMVVAQKHAVLDRIRWGGEFRFQAHNITADIPDHFNGIGVQGDLVNTIFYVGATGAPPQTPDPVTFRDTINQFIAQNYGDYLAFADNLDFATLSQIVGSFPPEQQQALFGLILPNNFVPGYEHDNSILYTSRLRLRMQADIADNVTFDGRLAMYKTWGDSTGVQVFNGQPTSISWDGTTASVPNSDIVRVERAYFNWTNIGGQPVYLSIGRRPSTGGAPLNFREDEPRGGTPLGSLINYQFDGITLGWHLGEYSTLRFCYGLGYESEWGNGTELVRPENRLDDAWFWGLNWDIWDTKKLFVQATVAQAVDVTDGFNALAVLPVDPLTGRDLPPAVIRFTPSENLGDVNLASIVAIRHDGPFDYFFSLNWSETDPTNVTTPFGGLLSDPFERPEGQTGHMYYLGGRYNFANGATKIGVEFNHGSKYWFNFALAEDDLLGPKTSVRGDVWEIYLTHRIRDNFVLKLDYIDYSYDYSGSGWLLGAPQPLDQTPIIGFPTYDQSGKFMLSFSARL